MKHTITGFITYTKRVYSDQEKFSFQVYAVSAEYQKDTIAVCEHSFEVEVPDDFDPRVGLIANLKEIERKTRADFEAKITEIKRQISQYEAISMDEPK